jgi:hypothetical protein
MISTGTRESEHASTQANGSCFVSVFARMAAKSGLSDLGRWDT